MENTLKKIDATLKTLAGALALLSGSTYAGFIPAQAAIVLGFLAGIFAFAAGSPLLDPTLIGKGPWVSRLFLTLGGLAAAAAGSTFFPQVQALFAEGTAHKIATGVMLFGALCTFLAQSPVIAGGTVGAGPSQKLGVLAVFLGLAFGSTGCATVQPIVKDVEVCAGPAAADLAKKALDQLPDIIMCDAAAGFSGGALPACAVAGLGAWAAAAGPDGWRIVDCVVNAIEKDMTKPPELRARARAAKPYTARKAMGL